MSFSKQAAVLAALAVLAAAVHMIALHGMLGRDSSDIRVHARWAFQFIQALGEGHLYPRWASYSHLGLGDPTFLYIHPLFYYATAAVYGVVGDLWQAILLLVALVNIVTAWCTYFVARRFAPDSVAIWAGAGACLSPYAFHLAQYQQFLPMYFALPALVLFFGAVLVSGPRNRIHVTALAVAFLTASHILVALMALMCTGAALLWRLAVERRAALKPLLQHAAGVTLGLSLVALYLLPALTTQQLINPAGWFDPKWLNWRNSFLFQYLTVPADGMRWAHLQWTIALLSLLGCAGAAWLLRHAAPEPSGKKRRGIELVMATATALLLGSELAYPLWEHLPVLPRLQFPLRFLHVASVSALLALAWAAMLVWHSHRRRAQLVVGGFVCASALMLGALEYRFSKEAVPVAGLMALNHVMEGQVEMRPATAGDGWRAYAEQGGLAAECRARGLECRQTLEKTHARAWIFKATGGPSSVHLPLLAFPGWSYRVNGQEAPLPIDAANGLPQVALAPGRTTVEAFWTGLPQERWGAGISAAALALLLAVAAGARNRQPLALPRHDRLAPR